MDDLKMIWLEITGKCQLECVHCYADSGPHGTHGDMAPADWIRIIDEAAELGCGYVQFIGGEPMLHPALGELVAHAADKGLRVGIYSNLVKVPGTLWPVLERDGVELLTSYYAADEATHNAITRRRSHHLTRANISEARRRGVPVHVGVIDLGQGVPAAIAEMSSVATSIETDRLRSIGRGGRSASTRELCGGCSEPRLAVMPDGSVHPCVMSRWLELGSVHRAPLAEIHRDAAPTRAALESDFEAQRVDRECIPRCRPTICYCEPIRPK